MKSTNDNAVDPLGSLGSPIRPSAPKPPDVVKPFETVPHEIADTTNAIETISEALKSAGLPTVTDGQEADWQGLCLDAYSRALLGCI